MAHNHPTDTDVRAEALARTIGMVDGHHQFDMCDAIDGAEYLVSGRRGVPIDMPAPKLAVVPDEPGEIDGEFVTGAQWFRRKLALALARPFGQRNDNQLIHEVEELRVGYARVLAQRAELFTVAEAVAEAKDIQLNDDVMCRLRIAVAKLAADDAA